MQNYAQRNQFANQTQLLRQPLSLTEDQARTWIDYFYDEDQLTDEERSWARFIPVLNDAMAPQLHVGCGVIITELTCQEAKAYMGKVVAITMKEAHQDYYIGRLKSITKEKIVLAQDDPIFPELTFKRGSVLGFHLVKLCIGSTVL